MKKAIITITPNRHYVLSHKDGAEYISVSMEGHNYGSSSPCDTNEEVERSIKSAKEWIINEGQTYMIIDNRPKKPILDFKNSENPIEIIIDRTRRQQVLF